MLDNVNNNPNVWKTVTAAMLAALITFIGMWLTLSPAVITRAEAQSMMEERLVPTQEELKKIESKQDQLQQTMDDVRERLARVEERIR